MTTDLSFYLTIAGVFITGITIGGCIVFFYSEKNRKNPLSNTGFFQTENDGVLDMENKYLKAAMKVLGVPESYLSVAIALIMIRMEKEGISYEEAERWVIEKGCRLAALEKD